MSSELELDDAVLVNFGSNLFLRRVIFKSNRRGIVSICDTYIIDGDKYHKFIKIGVFKQRRFLFWKRWILIKDR